MRATAEDIPMERSAVPASWTFGGVSVVALLALAWLGTAGVGAWKAKGPAGEAKAASAAVQVVVTDGTDARLWLERPGAPPRAMPLSCETSPGPVALRVARHTADGAWRQDTVELELQPGRLHLVPIGAESVRIEARLKEPSELPWRHPFPGVVSRSTRDGALGLGDPGQAPVPLDTTLVAQPDTADGAGWLPARERMLVLANPFLREIRCTVAAQHGMKTLDWRVECTLPALGCRVFALGGASGVRVSCARADDHAAIGESQHTPPPGPGRPLLYTVGGATHYAWFGQVQGRMPPVPTGEWAELPEGLEIRPRQVNDPPHWMLVARGPGGEVGLAPVISAPLVHLGTANPLQARADVVARELALPADLRNKAVGAVAAAGKDLWGAVDGVVHDLRTGKPLHAPGGALVAQMVATPHGVVLLTRSGHLATLKDGQLVLGAFLYDPTLRLAPAPGDPPAIWVYGGAFGATLARQPLDGSPATPQTRSGPGEAGPAEEEVVVPVEEPNEAHDEMGEDPAGTGETGDLGTGSGAGGGETGEGCGTGESCGTSEGETSGSAPDAPSAENTTAVTALAAASGDGMLLGSGRRIERMQPSPGDPNVWNVAPVLTLPEGGPDVLGLLDLDGRLLFATEECVYELRGNLVLPLVEGIGGPLVPWNGGVVVSDERSGRLYHLSGAAFLAPKGEPR